MSSSALILIVDDRRDVLELNRILLEAEGYATETSTYAGLTPDWLRQHRPAVVLLDLVAGDGAPRELLRRLRQDEATRGIGVVVTSDAPGMVDDILRDKSLGVSGGLVMPFAIEDLYAAIATAARHGKAPITSVAPVILLQRAAAALRQDHKRLLLRWAQRLSTFDAYRAHADLSLAELQGHGEPLLRGVSEALELGVRSRMDAAAALGGQSHAARDHARLRRAQGIGVDDLARELVALRNEAWREIAEDVLGDDLSPGETQELLRRLSLAFDETLFVMLGAWNESEQES